jgi:DNA-binding CsgD family transcriptional regulator
MVGRLPRSGPDMTTREKQTLVLLTKGHTCVAAAKILCITPSYVNSIVYMLKIRFGVNTVAGIVARAIAEGVISPEGELLIE